MAGKNKDLKSLAAEIINSAGGAPARGGGKGGGSSEAMDDMLESVETLESLQKKIALTEERRSHFMKMEEKSYQKIEHLTTQMDKLGTKSVKDEKSINKELTFEEKLLKKIQSTHEEIGKSQEKNVELLKEGGKEGNGFTNMIGRHWAEARKEGGMFDNMLGQFSESSQDAAKSYKLLGKQFPSTTDATVALAKRTEDFRYQMDKAETNVLTFGYSIQETDEAFRKASFKFRPEDSKSLGTAGQQLRHLTEDALAYANMLNISVDEAQDLQAVGMLRLGKSTSDLGNDFAAIKETIQSTNTELGGAVLRTDDFAHSIFELAKDSNFFQINMKNLSGVTAKVAAGAHAAGLGYDQMMNVAKSASDILIKPPQFIAVQAGDKLLNKLMGAKPGEDLQAMIARDFGDLKPEVQKQVQNLIGDIRSGKVSKEAGAMMIQEYVGGTTTGMKATLGPLQDIMKSNNAEWFILEQGWAKTFVEAKVLKDQLLDGSKTIDEISAKTVKNNRDMQAFAKSTAIIMDSAANGLGQTVEKAKGWFEKSDFILNLAHKFGIGNDEEDVAQSTKDAGSSTSATANLAGVAGVGGSVLGGGADAMSHAILGKDVGAVASNEFSAMKRGIGYKGQPSDDERKTTKEAIDKYGDKAAEALVDMGKAIEMGQAKDMVQRTKDDIAYQHKLDIGVSGRASEAYDTIAKNISGDFHEVADPLSSSAKDMAELVSDVPGDLAKSYMALGHDIVGVFDKNIAKLVTDFSTSFASTFTDFIYSSVKGVGGDYLAEKVMGKEYIQHKQSADMQSAAQQQVAQSKGAAAGAQPSMHISNVDSAGTATIRMTGFSGAIAQNQLQVVQGTR